MSGRKKMVIAMTILYSLSFVGALCGIALQAVKDNKADSGMSNEVSNVVQLETQGSTSASKETQGIVQTKTSTETASVAQTRAGMEVTSVAQTKAGMEVTSVAQTKAGMEVTSVAQTKASTEATSVAQTKAQNVSADAIGTAVADKGSVTIRQEANKDSELVGWVGRNATCEVLGEVKNGWVKIRHNNKVGYVDASYLTITIK